MDSLESQIRNRSALSTFKLQEEIDSSDQMAAYFERILLCPVNDKELNTKSKYLYDQHLDEIVVDKNTWERLGKTEKRPREFFKGSHQVRWLQLAPVIGSNAYENYLNGPEDCNLWTALFGDRNDVEKILDNHEVWYRYFNINKEEVKDPGQDLIFEIETSKILNFLRTYPSSKEYIDFLRKHTTDKSLPEYDSKIKKLAMLSLLVCIYRSSEIFDQRSGPETYYSSSYRELLYLLNDNGIKSELHRHNVFNLVKKRLEKLERNRLLTQPTIKKYSDECEKYDEIIVKYLDKPFDFAFQRLLSPPIEDLLSSIKELAPSNYILTREELWEYHLSDQKELRIDNPINSFNSEIGVKSLNYKYEKIFARFSDLLSLPVYIDGLPIKYNTSVIELAKEFVVPPETNPNPKANWSRKVSNFIKFDQIIDSLN